MRGINANYLSKNFMYWILYKNLNVEFVKNKMKNRIEVQKENNLSL